MTKHASDLLQHAKAKKNSELSKLAEHAFNIASDMAEVKNKKEYLLIRDLEHRAEDLITGLRNERKKITGCETCNSVESAISNLNMGGDQFSSREEITMTMQKEIVTNALVGNIAGKGVSKATAMFVSGSTMGITNKTLVNVVIGGVLTGAALYGKLKKANMLGAIVGTNLLADELVEMAMGAIAPAPATSMVVAPARVAASGLYQTTYNCGGLSTVD
jgi:hypothetical protein